MLQHQVMVTTKSYNLSELGVELPREEEIEVSFRLFSPKELTITKSWAGSILTINQRFKISCKGRINIPTSAPQKT